MPTTSCSSKKAAGQEGRRAEDGRQEQWGSPEVVVWKESTKGGYSRERSFLPSLMFPLPRPAPPHPRKADEGLASLSEDGRSPISIRQMAYGEPREMGWRRALDTFLSQGSR